MTASECFTKHMQQDTFPVNEYAVQIYEDDDSKEDCSKLRAMFIFIVMKVYFTAWEDCC